MLISDWSSDVCSSDLVERRDEPRFDSGPPPPYLAARRNHSVMDVTMNHLDALEAQSVYILREAFNKFDRLGMLWSLGKDSNVMLWLAKKAFFGHEIGRAHVLTPVTNAHLVCRLLLEKKKHTHQHIISYT